MKKSSTKIICPPLWIVILVVLVLVLAGGLYFRDDLNTKSARANAALTTTLRKEQAEVAKMATLHSDEKAAEAEAAAQRFRQALLTSEQAQTLLNKAGAGWQVSASAQESNPDFNRTTYTLNRGSGPVAEWDAFIAFFRQLQAAPGVVVDSLDISASGDSQRRVFSRLTLRVSIYLKKAAVAAVAADTETAATP